ncbi:hypothetical protein AAD018_013855 [Aestuariibius insulae]|uniref:hypothetical protein n=1 Tax=Aestuariibius insulae TaxID=2058287 RepID=UPI00345E277A
MRHASFDDGQNPPRFSFAIIDAQKRRSVRAMPGALTRMRIQDVIRSRSAWVIRALAVRVGALNAVIPCPSEVI